MARDPLGAKRRIGYLPEGSPLYGDMTPKSLLAFVAAVRGLRGEEKRRRIAWAVEQTALAEVLHRRIETLSKGFRRRVGIAQAILHDPEVLVLDEPTDGLDPNQKHGVRELIRELGRDKAIIISTHILEEVDAVCDRAIVINRGRLVGEGTPEALHARAREHNAVRIRVAGSDTEAVAALCRDSPFVAAVEITRRAATPGFSPLRVKGRSSPTESAPPLRQARVPVVEMHSEVGRLDDVFRAMTLGAGASGRRLAVRAIFVVARREMASYFSTPLAYVFLIIFLAAAAAAPLLFGGFFERRQADLTTFFVFHPWLLLVLVPAIGMRLWAEERRVGTIELLMTLPITVWQAVLGKFLAAWAFAGLALALTFPIWVTVNMLGDPDNGVILASYIGSFLMAGAFLALSSAISALTTSQVVAFVLSVSAGFLLLVTGLDFVAALARNWLPQYAVDLIASYSLLTHFSSITEGVLEMRGIVFFLTIILLLLFINKELVELRKAA